MNLLNYLIGGKKMNIENIGTKYCLHDCVIDKIEIRDSNLILCSNKGIYEHNVNTGIFKIMKKCNIHIKIDNFVEEESYEHISICVFKKNIRKNISFDKLCKMVNDNNFKIYLDFYSYFAQGLLLKGYCNKYEIELSITEINDIQFIFN